MPDRFVLFGDRCHQEVRSGTGRPGLGNLGAEGGGQRVEAGVRRHRAIGGVGVADDGDYPGSLGQGREESPFRGHVVAREVEDDGGHLDHPLGEQLGSHVSSFALVVEPFPKPCDQTPVQGHQVGQHVATGRQAIQCPAVDLTEVAVGGDHRACDRLVVGHAVERTRMLGQEPPGGGEDDGVADRAPTGQPG